MLSLAERYKHDGLVEGKVALADEARELYEKGLDPQEILKMIMNQGSQQGDYVLLEKKQP